MRQQVIKLAEIVVNILSWGYFYKYRQTRSQYRHTLGQLKQTRKLYLDLMEICLTGIIYEDAPYQILGLDRYDATTREYGYDWPTKAHTMIGRRRLANVRKVTESVINNQVPGNFIETGAWRGGACIMMRAVLEAYGIKNRQVWVADSFEGLPAPSPEIYPADKESKFHEYKELAVSLEEVQDNFRKYGLLDEQVNFLKGWFKDTLPSAPIEQLALLRLDGDLYESTQISLEFLYDKVSPGGYVIVDDYHIVQGCKQAVQDFCASRRITPEFREIDGVGIYWQKKDQESRRPSPS